MVAHDATRATATSGNVRERTLAEATRLFAAHGFDGTPLQSIADAVGVSKPAVLHHFPSKEALRESVLDELLSRWNEIVPRILLAATAGNGRFDGIMQEMVVFFRADPDRARLLMREVLDRPDAMRELLRKQVRPWVTAVAEHIRSGQATGEIPAGVDPEAYVMNAIQLVVAGIASLDVMSVLLAGPTSQHEERYVREMLRVTRSGLFAEAPRPIPSPPPPRKARRVTKR